MGLFLDSQLCVINLYVCCYASTTLFWLLQLWGKFFYYSNSEIYFYFIYFFVLLYNTVSVLLYIDMNPPWVYMSSQSWTPLPPLSPYHLSGSSQCTSPKHPVSCIKPRLVIHFLHDSIHVALNFKCNYLFNYRNSVCFQTYIIVFSRLIFTHIVSLKSTCLTSCSHNIKILSFYRAHSTVFCFCCGSHSWTFSIFTVIALMGWHFLEL